MVVSESDVGEAMELLHKRDAASKDLDKIKAIFALMKETRKRKQPRKPSGNELRKLPKNVLRKSPRSRNTRKTSKRA